MKTSCNLILNTIPKSNYHIKIVMVNIALYLAISLLTN